MVPGSKGLVYASRGKARRITVRGVQRDGPDLKRLSVLLIEMAKADLAVKQAAAESATSTGSSRVDDAGRRAA